MKYIFCEGESKVLLLFEMFMRVHERHSKKNVELFATITTTSKCLQKNEVRLLEKRKNKKQRRDAIQRGFSKMGQIMTKERCTLDDNSLDMMRISYRKEP